jgi:hypothetical protein
VIAALERARLAALGRAELGAAVPADVQERAERAVLAAHDEDALVSDAHGAIVPGRRELVRAAHGHPEAPEEPLLLEPPDGGIVVEAPGQGPREGAPGCGTRLHAAATSGNTTTLRRASPPSIATMASLIRSSG